MDPNELRRTKEIMNSTSERLMLCGWATRSIDSERGLGIQLTEKGSDGLEKLYRAIESLDPDAMEHDHMVGVVLHAIMRNKVRRGKG
jgi:hypothetical protein